MIQTVSRTAAGARKPAASAYLLQRPTSWSGGGAATTGGSPAMLPPLLMLLAERLCGRGLHLLRDLVDVGRVLQEVLEQLEEALADGAAELGGLQVGEVEAERLDVGERTGRRLGDVVRIDTRVHVLVQGGEAALGSPDLSGLWARQVLHERLGGRAVLEHDDRVAAAHDHLGRAVDGREREDVEAGSGLGFGRVGDDAGDEVA